VEDRNTFQDRESKEEKPLDLESIDSDTRQMDALLKKLEQKASVLPKVEKDGYSECPFARDLYSVKEEAEEKVTTHLKKLRRNVAVLKKEIYKCKKNLQLIQSDANHLHLEDTIRNYAIAEGSLERYYTKAVDLKPMLDERIAHAIEMLNKTKGKKWPLGKAGKSSDTYVPAFRWIGPSERQAPFRPEPSRLPELNRSPLNREIDNLMSLGPLPGPNFARFP
jgi:hypothetical protein